MRLRGAVVVAGLLAAGLAAVPGTRAAPAPPAASAPSGTPASVRVEPSGRWQMAWHAGQAVWREAPGSPWLERVTEELTLSVQLSRHVVWRAGPVAWRAEAALRAAGIRRRERLTDLLGERTQAERWTWDAWVSRLALSALRADPASGGAVELFCALLWEGPPGAPPRPAMAAGITLSRVMDPALVAASVSLSAGPRAGAEVAAAGEWRLMVTEALSVFTGASTAWSAAAGHPAARVWTGLSLLGGGGREVGLLLQRPLGDPEGFGLHVEAALPD